MITLDPGQDLFVQSGENNGHPVYQRFTWHEIQTKLMAKQRNSTSRRSKTPESATSRAIGLLGRAITSGKWSTGAPINRTVAFDKLISLVTATPVPQLLTANAKSVIEAMYDQAAGYGVQLAEERQRKLYQAYNRDVVRP